MSDFDASSWAASGGASEYLDVADTCVPERATLLGILSSCYRWFLAHGRASTILDLGCGDGVLAEVLCSMGVPVRVIEIDGSQEMLDASRRRLARFESVEYHHKTFQEIISGGLEWTSVDLVASSLAIHHLEPPEKQALYARIHDSLNEGGFFINIDVVLPRSGCYEAWYYDLWREWISRRQQRSRLQHDYTGIPEEARTNPENKFQTLDSQMAMLRDVGFRDVECFYRYGLFGLFGGRK